MVLADKYDIEALQKHAVKKFAARESDIIELQDVVTQFFKDFPDGANSDLKHAVADKVGTHYDLVRNSGDNQAAKCIQTWLKADGQFLLLVTDALHEKLRLNRKRTLEKEEEYARKAAKSTQRSGGRISPPRLGISG